MKILVLEPFYGGSHRQFLDRWRELSRHCFDLLTFSAHHWKWRMRHSAIDFAAAVEKKAAAGETWDAALCTDMLNLAECRGLAPVLTRLPTVAYFHENQLTYPVREEKERDHHFAFTNLTTALAADRVWWNSAFHRDDFLSAAEVWLRRLPKPRPLDALGDIRAKSDIVPQGIRPIPGRAARKPGPLRILWAARWELDKDPDAFFAVIDALEARDRDYRISVVGQRFPECPPVFDSARERLAHRIDRWGFQATREDYESCLREADVFVSTAQHEFFGVAAAEAMAAGCYPLLPNRLAYPDLLQALPIEQRDEFLYGSNEDLRRLLETLIARVEGAGSVWTGDPNRVVRAMEPFHWPSVAARLDTGIEALVGE